MITYAFIGTDGLPTGGGIGKVVPAGAVELPPSFSTNDLRRIRLHQGAFVERDNLVVEQPPSPEIVMAQADAILRRAKDDYVNRINRAIDRIRRQHYTAIAGQDALYLEKRTEALAYVREVRLSGEPVTMAEYPLIENEIGVTAPTAWQLAQIWLHQSRSLHNILAATERPRQMALTAIAEASDELALAAIETAFGEELLVIEYTDHRAALAAVRVPIQPDNVAQSTAEDHGAVGTPST